VSIPSGSQPIFGFFLDPQFYSGLHNIRGWSNNDAIAPPSRATFIFKIAGQPESLKSFTLERREISKAQQP
jgi:hypothetical protein